MKSACLIEEGASTYDDDDDDVDDVTRIPPMQIIDINIAAGSGIGCASQSNEP